ncbi:MAG: hypothetical protein EZS28_006872 [Streblomastix strix]|uniref:Tetratricopeptide repeat protein 29 n=2 Tax=Streblomastix strix TaxID=222440 RepID=A0A5J4WRR3_9EUKA|nr:MAG: hypothetical protein EZS28_006872 [Streblomastix strix]
MTAKLGQSVRGRSPGKLEKMKITVHKVQSVFTPIPEIPRNLNSLSNNTQRHDLCLDILKSGCIDAFAEFFNVTKEVDWIESATDQMRQKPDKPETEEERRRRELFVNLPYLKDNLTQAEVAERNNNSEVVYESYKKTAAFFSGINDIPNSQRFYNKSLDTANGANLLSMRAEACLQLAKGFQSQNSLDQAITYYEQHHEMIQQCGTEEEKHAAKEYLMQVYELMADKLEHDKHQLTASHTTSHHQHKKSVDQTHGGKSRGSFGSTSGLLSALGIQRRTSVLSISGRLENEEGNQLTQTRTSLNSSDDESNAGIGQSHGMNRLTSANSALTHGSLSGTLKTQQTIQDDEKIKELVEKLFLYLGKFLEMARALENVPNEVKALRLLARHCEKSKEYKQAIEYSLQLLELCNQKNDSVGAGEACHALAGAYTALGQMDEAVRYLEMRMSMAEKDEDEDDQQKEKEQGKDDQDGNREQTSTLGQILIKTGKFEEAIKFFERNFKTARKAAQLSQEKYQEDLQEQILSRIGVGKNKGKKSIAQIAQDLAKEGEIQTGQSSNEQNNEQGNISGAAEAMLKSQLDKKKKAAHLTVGATATMKIVPQNQSGFVEQARVNLGIAKGNQNLLNFLSDIKSDELILLGENPATDWMTKKALESAAKNEQARPVRVEIVPQSVFQSSLIDSAFVLKIVDLEPVTPVVLRMCVFVGGQLISISSIGQDININIQLNSSFIQPQTPIGQVPQTPFGQIGQSQFGQTVSSPNAKLLPPQTPIGNSYAQSSSQQQQLLQQQQQQQQKAFSCIADFLSDGKGTISLPTMSPTAGAYQHADAMGMFWSLEEGDLNQRDIERRALGNGSEIRIGGRGRYKSKAERLREEEEAKQRALAEKRRREREQVVITGQMMITANMDENMRKLILIEREKLSIEEQMLLEEKEDEEKRRLEEEEAEDDDDEGDEEEEILIAESKLERMRARGATLAFDGQGTIAEEPEDGIVIEQDSGLNQEEVDSQQKKDNNQEQNENKDKNEINQEETSNNEQKESNNGELNEKEQNSENQEENLKEGKQSQQGERMVLIKRKRKKRGKLPSRYETAINQQCKSFLEQTRSLQPIEYKMDIVLGKDTIVGSVQLVRTWLGEGVTEIDDTNEWDIDGVDVRGFIPPQMTENLHLNDQNQQQQQQTQQQKNLESSQQIEGQQSSNSDGTEQQQHGKENETGNIPEYQPQTEQEQQQQQLLQSKDTLPSHHHSRNGSDNQFNLTVTTQSSQQQQQQQQSEENGVLLPIVIVVSAGGGPTLMKGGFTWSAHVAGLLASHGYASFAISIHDTRPEGRLPKIARGAPLEGISGLLNYLRATPPYAFALDFNRVYGIGYRVGASYILSMASRLPTLFHTIVAISPASHIFESPRPTDHTPLRSPFSYEGNPLPCLHVPLDETFFANYDFIHTSKFYERALQKSNPSELEAAAIHPEKFTGRILMISFEEDQIWPSQSMCEVMLAKMTAEKEKNDRRKRRKRVQQPAYQFGSIQSQYGRLGSTAVTDMSQTSTAQLQTTGRTSDSDSIHTSNIGQEEQSSKLVGVSGGNNLPELSSVNNENQGKTQDQLNNPQQSQQLGSGVGVDGSQVPSEDSSSAAAAQAAAQELGLALDNTKTLQFGLGSLHNKTFNPNTMMSGMTAMMQEQPERELTWKHIKLQLKVDFWPPYLPVAGRVGNATDSASKLQTVNIEKDTWKTIIDYLET